MNKKILLLSSGSAILLALFLMYFIKVNVEQGANYIVEDSILGIVIFHNPFVLGIYALIAIALIVIGLRRKN